MAITKATITGHQGAGVEINDIQVVGEQVANIPNLVITWTSNEPTAGDAQTIANGSVPTVLELGQAVKNLNAKIDALIAAFEAHGLTASV